MRTFFTLALGLLLLAPLAIAQDEPIASGTIKVGSPTISAITVAEAADVEGVDSFFFPAPAAGTVITSVTVDNGGLGYDIDFFFFDAEGNYVASECQNAGTDEICAVPEGAVTAEAAAWIGADLEVYVFVA